VIDPGEECEDDGDCGVSETCQSCQCVGTGDVRVTLEWDGATSDFDFDLHVVDPSGEEIDFGNTTSASGGELDTDQTCSPAGPRVENIFWPVGGAPTGTYTVYVDNFSDCGGGGVGDFTVTTEVDGVVTVFPENNPTVQFCSTGGCGAGSCCTLITSFSR
jgi:uncharacterized protein YfaP (DUF2135 family)